MSRASTRAIRRTLPPSPAHPRIVQTIGGQRWPYAYLEHCQRVCGGNFTLYPIDMPPMVFLTSPTDIRTVLTGDPAELHPGAGAAIIAPVIGRRSFMLLEEEEHDYGRKAINPAFHRRMVAEQSAILTEMVKRAIATWPVNQPIPLYPYIRSLTLAVVLRIIFSDRGAELHRLHKGLMQMLNVTDSFLLQEPKLRFLPGWRGTWLRFQLQRTEVDGVLYQLVRDRRSSGTGRRADLLDLLLTAENPDGSFMSDQQIRDNLMSMILAGHETTTGELAWAFQLLSHHPDVQSRLAEEIRCSTTDDYLTATVHETLRHRPVFLFAIPRKVIAPIEIGGWTYRPPVHLAACTYLMHHNPELYPEPHCFKPERFLGRSPQPRTWLPWGGGRKHCLGRHFAMLEVRTILRHVLLTRKVLPASSDMEPPRWRSAILVPSSGGRVILEAWRGGRAPITEAPPGSPM
jgi:cytochrome P450